METDKFVKIVTGTLVRVLGLGLGLGLGFRLS